MISKGNLSNNFLIFVKGVIHYYNHHGRSAIFVALLLLSIPELNLTISCVSWDHLMSVIKHFAMSVCISVCALNEVPITAKR